MMSEMNPPIKVQILGKEYPISCPEDQQHDLLIAARYLDEKMRQIRGTGRVIGTERIAVMAALNIAHELLQAQQQNKLLSQDLRDRFSSLHERLDAALDTD
ncbi:MULTISPECIES: cell division protein ZapA [Methylocaldum]|jgi:cell division protein ZapA|uniref:cell division protein ZapA n=2 Tax=Methylocaldum TaxID=73778 RepID=UPI001B7B45B1|nr:cell division protein ZapA [Methylocaldum sp. 14B]MBP1149476.1 cell division protein ZapA [Methylocaldum sp. RMAD-M]MDV3243013.1 cell division protein ZapA [Methylocaldum sp.]